MRCALLALPFTTLLLGSGCWRFEDCDPGPDVPEGEPTFWYELLADGTRIDEEGSGPVDVVGRQRVEFGPGCSDGELVTARTSRGTFRLALHRDRPLCSTLPLVELAPPGAIWLGDGPYGPLFGRVEYVSAMESYDAYVWIEDLVECTEVDAPCRLIAEHVGLTVSGAPIAVDAVGPSEVWEDCETGLPICAL